MNSTRIAAVTAALSLGLAACGGGGTLSKKDLAKKANSICEKAAKDGKAVKQPANLTDAKQAAAYFDKVAPIIDKETSDLDALKPASSVKSDWNDFMAQQKKANSLLQTIKKKADTKDASGLKDLQKFSGLASDIESAGKKVGATSCT